MEVRKEINLFESSKPSVEEAMAQGVACTDCLAGKDMFADALRFEIEVRMYNGSCLRMKIPAVKCETCSGKHVDILSPLFQECMQLTCLHVLLQDDVRDFTVLQQCITLIGTFAEDNASHQGVVDRLSQLGWMDPRTMTEEDTKRLCENTALWEVVASEIASLYAKGDPFVYELLPGKTDDLSDEDIPLRVFYWVNEE